MRIDPYAAGGALRSQLEALDRAQLQSLAEEVIKELSRRAFRSDEEDERKKKSADTGRSPFVGTGRIGW